MTAFLEYIRSRIANNKNFLASITGPTGSGKSYSALRLGEALDPAFSIDRVAFKPLEFMQILQKDDLEAGSVVVFDEAGVGMSHKEWQSVHNRLINFVLQTFRHRNYIVIFTTPHMAFIDSSSRKLFHCHMETVGINTERKFCRIKPLLLQVNQRKGDTYFKYLRLLLPERGLVPLKRINVPLPSRELRVAYENKKTAYTAALNKDILRDLEDRESKKNRPLTPRQEQIIDLLQQGHLPRVAAEIAGVHSPYVYQIIKQARKKGWEINPLEGVGKTTTYEVIPP